MKSVSVHNFPSESYLSEPVFLDEKYILLCPDIPITEELKQRLLTWGISRIFTDGSPTSGPPQSIAVGEERETPSETPAGILESNIKEKEKREEVQKFFSATSQFLAKIFERYLTKNEIHIGEVSEKIKEIITMVKNNRKHLLRLTDFETDEQNYISSHSVKTAIIALVLADVLKLPHFKQIEVGLAGLFHEIGMLRIPPQLYMTKKQLTPQEKQTINAHTVLGFRILKDLSFPMTVTRAVLEHHERIDGSGYPRGLTGDKIAFYAKILAAACSYVAIVSDRPHREAADGHTGMMELLKNTGKHYDEQIIRLLVYCLSIYPIGTFVL
ncbi:MAG: HD domain-containing phosphohydrolase, partial [Spirochaetota bacterium]